ncbi:hypothetical protein [Nocardioides ganghwensis]|uniref:Uncharacterized protein n=1 Tax=Nocardioides ganghwensis TaxID=252230 RepID=A0A4Q2S9T3_9ACTN|nr:hypothetical protein [Nocardioides ganghwensis]MBD3947520.1 hypothetical protein [Nocardioides ganghwensis]RYB99837.1 hypothetical protein EUA07_15195 [Nocardioides ganghwensis]
MLAVLAAWPARRWLVAVGATLAYTLLVAIPTDLVDTPVFGREVPPTWWAWPALVASSLLAGLLTASYVAAPPPSDAGDTGGADRAARGGWAGGVLTFFAVGCPVCNKLVLLALGSAGAMTWFEPVQPLLQLAAVGVLVWALDVRLRGERACPVR